MIQEYLMIKTVAAGPPLVLLSKNWPRVPGWTGYLVLPRPRSDFIIL